MAPVVVSGLFYGYSAELIAEWCDVSLATARRWKTGKSSPSRSALKLFRLCAARKVMLSPAWDGWAIKGAILVDPEGNETTQSQLRAYYFVYKLARELARDDAPAWERLDELARLAG